MSSICNALTGGCIAKLVCTKSYRDAANYIINPTEYTVSKVAIQNALQARAQKYVYVKKADEIKVQISKLQRDLEILEGQIDVLKATYRSELNRGNHVAKNADHQEVARKVRYKTCLLKTANVIVNTIFSTSASAIAYFAFNYVNSNLLQPDDSLGFCPADPDIFSNVTKF